MFHLNNLHDLINHEASLEQRWYVRQTGNEPNFRASIHCIQGSGSSPVY
ncbi:hypothetical protein MY11210_008245 [Beauveria gryllotalpidicola]